MAITPADIEQMQFTEAKKGGYTTEEVDAFLDQLAVEVDAMLKKIVDLKDRLSSSEQQLAASQAQVAQLKEQAASAPAEVTAPASAFEYTPSERQISQVLIVAQQSADKLVADARANAENIRNEADQKAREVIRQALAEKQNELDEIDRLHQSCEDFRADYKKMLQHFMDDADAVFPEQASGAPKADAYAAPVAAPADGETVYTAPVAQQGTVDFSDLD